ncbi:MAG: M36 family metallopeptidase, partial [Acidobacteria bacterium]|nr:M36 family metallopeptidase [Acidobacteriota bacterium]
LVFVLGHERPIAKGGAGLFHPTSSHDPEIENYDIRTDKKAIDKVAAFRSSMKKSASDAAEVRDSFNLAEAELKARIPTLKIEYNQAARIPEVIAPDVKRGRAMLSSPSNGKRSDVLKGFLKANKNLVGANAAEVEQLEVRSNYTNPDGNLSFVELEQKIGDVPVFQGRVKAGFTKRGELVRVVNGLAAAVNESTVSADFRSPETAVRTAAESVNFELKPQDLQLNQAQSDNLKSVFGDGDFAPRAEKTYFAIEPGVAIPAWRVLIWGKPSGYLVVVSAETGEMLWRKNITEDQTEAATYNVYANPNAMINVADNPFPFSPGPISPGGQGAGISRTLVTRIGNEAPYTFNDLGWITDGNSQTNGNNVEAGLDRDANDGVDTTNGRATSASRVFDFPLNPGNPNTNTGDSPTPAGEPVSGCSAIAQPHGMIDAQRAAITHMFYVMNWYHDETYRLGFTEAAGNFQSINFGRGGLGNDRVSAQAQDCSGVDNANFGTPPDGARPVMQMFIWDGPNPDFDGDLDSDLIIHEATHGLSSRLHGDAQGLTTKMARGMGEGWSDFFANSLLSEPGDPINAVYATSGYASYNITPGFAANNYYGIRRFPKAVMAFTGGPSSRPHNPLTFADIDATQSNISDGAFARGPVGSGIVDQVHNIGEIWSSALWEMRARMVARLGWADGNRRALQVVVDGMKLAPI